MGWMWFFWLIVIVGLVLLVGWVARSSRGPGDSVESPEVILKRRYARGEIDKEEYERTLADLRR
jgi:putative membrane protein